MEVFVSDVSLQMETIIGHLNDTPATEDRNGDPNPPPPPPPQTAPPHPSTPKLRLRSTCFRSGKTVELAVRI